ncbi:N4-gp56 family major capsid protein [Pseudobutyrivibrio sp.]
MNKNRKLINLQLMAAVSPNATTDAALSDEMKTYYDKELIRLVSANLVHDQFAQTRDIPKGNGKTVEFRQFDPLPKSLTPLTEGVTPDGRKVSVNSKTADVEQYGDYVPYTDVIDLTAIDPMVLEITRLIADQAARTLDSITRDAIAAGTQVNYVNNRLSRSALTTADKIDVDTIIRAATLLKRGNTPKINGEYVGIIHPDVAYDLMRDPEFVEWQKYTTSDKLFKGEIGKIGGVRFVETTEAKIWNDNTCPVKTAASGDDPATYYSVYSTLIVGLNAYATTKVTDGGLQQIIKPIGYGNDPLNQRGSIGWKAMKVSEILVDAYMVRIESLSTYSDISDAN